MATPSFEQWFAAYNRACGRISLDPEDATMGEMCEAFTDGVTPERFAAEIKALWDEAARDTMGE